MKSKIRVKRSAKFFYWPIRHKYNTHESCLSFHASSTNSTNRQRTQLRPQAGLSMLLMLDLVAVTAVVVSAFNALVDSSVLPVL